MVYRSRGAWPMSAWLAMQALRATSTVGAQHAGSRARANTCASVSQHACKHGTSAWAACLVGGMTHRATDAPSRCRWHAGSARPRKVRRWQWQCAGADVGWLAIPDLENLEVTIFIGSCVWNKHETPVLF